MKKENEILKKIYEQLLQMNRNEHIHIIPVNDISYHIYDIDKNRLLSFVFNKEKINDNSESVELWIYDNLSLECSIFQVRLDYYAQTTSEKIRLDFAEHYIQEFYNIKDKETVLKILKDNGYNI